MKKQTRKRTIEYGTTEDVEKVFQKDVINHPEFRRHVQETADMLNITYDVAHDVLTHHNRTILYLISKIRKKSILVIHVYAFLFLEVLIDPLIIKTLKKRIRYEQSKSSASDESSNFGREQENQEK